MSKPPGNPGVHQALLTRFETSLTYHSYPPPFSLFYKDKKKAKEVVESPDRDRPRRRHYRQRRPPPTTESTLATDEPSTSVTNTETDNAATTPKETTPTFSTLQKGGTSSENKESHQMGIYSISIQQLKKVFHAFCLKLHRHTRPSTLKCTEVE